jgi:hypothetical protein
MKFIKEEEESGFISESLTSSLSAKTLSEEEKQPFDI